MDLLKRQKLPFQWVFAMLRFLPIKQKILEEAHERVAIVRKQYEDGIITEGERKSKTISIWTEVSDVLSEELFKLISEVKDSSYESVFI